MNAHLLLLTALLATLAFEASAEAVTAGTALAVAVAAVIGLKVAGLAGYAIARSLGGRGGRRRGGRRYGHRRGRRDTPAAELQEETYFQLVERVDTLGCGLRVICELEAREFGELEADERIILSLFGSRPQAPSYRKLTGSASGKYQLAAFLGAEKKDAKRCGQVFKSCPFSSGELMQALRSVDAQ